MLKIKANAKRTEILGVKDDRLQIKLHSPAAEGKANAELIKLLSKYFKVPQTNISIKTGASAPLKTLIITTDDAKQKNEFIARVSSLKPL